MREERAMNDDYVFSSKNSSTLHSTCFSFRFFRFLWTLYTFRHANPNILPLSLSIKDNINFLIFLHLGWNLPFITLSNSISI